MLDGELDTTFLYITLALLAFGLLAFFSTTLGLLARGGVDFWPLV
jgi:lipopolysaccharide export LptBFGC system permease protein LptF